MTDSLRTEAGYRAALAALPETCPTCNCLWPKSWAISYVGQTLRADCGPCGARHEWDGERWVEETS